MVSKYRNFGRLEIVNNVLLREGGNLESIREVRRRHGPFLHHNGPPCTLSTGSLSAVDATNKPKTGVEVNTP